MDVRQEERELRWRRWRERLFLPAMFLLLVSGLLTAAWFVSSDQRRSAGETKFSPERLAKMREVIDEHELNFATLVQRKARINEEDLAELEKAVALQEKYTDAAGNQAVDSNRLSNLRTRLHVYRAERCRELSEKLEAEAAALAEKADKARALGQPADEMSAKTAELLRQALAAEEEILRKWILSNLDQPGRRARLDIRLRRLEAEPLWEKGRSLERQSDTAAVLGDYAAAEQALREALAIEQDYALRFRDVKATEFDREARLQRKLDTVRSLSFKANVDELARKAEACEAAREWVKAADFWQAAAAGQLDLINRFPQSVHASRAQAETYAAAQALALAMPEVEYFRNGMNELRELLRTGNTAQAAVQASSLAARVDILVRTFPKALPAADLDRQQLSVIRERSASLGIIRESLVTQLLPVPVVDRKSFKLLRTEVTQALYSAVMGSNPSARREPSRPVESLTYDEAAKFCIRLGWLTGLKVRLPETAEYAAAMGDPARSPDPAEAWTLDNSDGQVRSVATSKPNPLGFHDLCGNVSEWARSDDGQATAPTVGGDAQSPPENGLPVAQVNRSEVSRLRGFRVAIDP